MAVDDGLKGKRSLVLCGTSGIGLGVARCLARDGSAVTVSGRDEQRAAEVAAGLPGTAHGAFACDFGDPGRVGQCAAATGPYDVVLLNSPGYPPGRVDELTPARLEEAMRLMLLPFQHVVEAVLPAMKRAGWGRLVAITSSSVEVPISGLAGSSVIRAAVSSYLRLLAEDVGPHGITVNQVLPGKIETGRLRAVEEAAARRRGTAVEQVREETLRTIPLGRYGTPEDVGELVAFLASDRAAYLTGTEIRCDGGHLTPA
jgi:3-oxoacyl-[acyl-carrier protein] reductase